MAARAATWKSLPGWVLEDAGVTVDAEGLAWIPYRLMDGSVYAHRVVAPSGRRWWEPGDGRPVVPFGLDRQEQPRFRRYAVLVVAEGESDALAACCAFAPCRIDALGVPGAGTWRTSWAAYCHGYAGVYVAGDGDEPGRSLNASVCSDVDGALELSIPDGEDLRSLLVRDRNALATLMVEADRQELVQRAWLQSDSLDDLERRLAGAHGGCWWPRCEGADPTGECCMAQRGIGA